MKNEKILLQLQLGNVYAEVVKKPGKGPLSVQSTFYRLFGDPEDPKRARSFSRAELDELDGCLEEVRNWYDAQGFESGDTAEAESADEEGSCDVVALDGDKRAA